MTDLNKKITQEKVEQKGKLSPALLLEIRTKLFRQLDDFRKNKTLYQLPGDNFSLKIRALTTPFVFTKIFNSQLRDMMIWSDLIDFIEISRNRFGRDGIQLEFSFLPENEQNVFYKVRISNLGEI